MSKELQDFIYEVSQDIVHDAFLDKLEENWCQLKEIGDNRLFEAFIAGNLSGALLFFYSSFEGKQILNLSEKEMKDLNQKLINNYVGIRSKIEKHIQKHECARSSSIEI
jgi:hypothetical protein